MKNNNEIERLSNEVDNLKKIISDFLGPSKELVKTQFDSKYKYLKSTALHDLTTAIVVSTNDPWKEGRVRFFCPFLHNPNQSIDELPYANPISAMGGHDDSGLAWVPPVGSTIALLFERGERQAAYYIGTIWSRDRGPDKENNFNYNNIPEFEELYLGRGENYNLGPKDGSQSLPPWNTESYNGKDIDSTNEVEVDPESIRKAAYPNIYGFKTPQKHMVKLVDGNYKCNYKNKRIEILSGCGNWMIMKDDPLHNTLSVAHPNDNGGSQKDCNDEGNLDCKTPPEENNEANEYFKAKNEGRPYKGPGTPQNNKCDLPQTGIQLLSLSGHSFVMDDSVEEPQGTPSWEKSLEDFDFGCSDKFKGRTYWVSTTGHKIELNDEEEDSNVRGEKNGILIKSALGNEIFLGDHTNKDCIGGEKRGISIKSTSTHSLEMVDEENDYCGEDRKEGGTPVAKAKKAFVKLKTGYGLEINMNDGDNQENTSGQYLEIKAPQKDKTEEGPHFIRMQEAGGDSQGQMIIRAGGDLIETTYGNYLLSIGDQAKNPSNMVTYVTKDRIDVSENVYINKSDVGMMLSNRALFLLAGQDGSEGGPTTYPVLVLTGKGVTVSDRVFASASDSAGCVSIFHLTPFHSCSSF